MAGTLEFQHICKYFPGVKALDDVSFQAHAGEVLAFLGENIRGQTLVDMSGLSRPEEDHEAVEDTP